MNFVHMAVMGGLGIEDETLVNDPKLCNATLREIRRVADQEGVEVMIPMEIPEDIAAGNVGAVTDAVRSDEGGGSALQQSAARRGTAGSFDVAAYLNHKIDEFLLKAKKKDDHKRACYFPWYYIHVNPDGTVFPCGSWFEFTSFGDFKTQSFEEIWAGEKFKELRRQIYNMELRDVCANCSVANMGRPDVLASFSHRVKVRRGDRTSATP
jgi:radical SAM protein with 4Fe4S-binding SPASM domain